MIRTLVFSAAKNGFKNGLHLQYYIHKNVYELHA